MVKTLACCPGGPGFDPRAGGEPKIFQGPSSAKSQLASRSDETLNWWPLVPCSVYAGQVKDPTHGVNV